MELIEIIINAAQEAFMHVGVLLAIVILLFGFYYSYFLYLI